MSGVTTMNAILSVAELQFLAGYALIEVTLPALEWEELRGGDNECVQRVHNVYSFGLKTPRGDITVIRGFGLHILFSSRQS